ncbi:esterase-like activity of phytase family protein [Croceicoccus sp. F390]|uniref:Esterase-like activity of phytase family protein n=1 Tax=Croceicoccus esteveae TaxID=3075597 RepID=A0ABU2ZFQ1_9SPHN|nr:esterase-like activity of phytase family protein [Croceicoccus sp. F390]MDT0575427.1 esterase-like activity of phytase family protein [Croceicoccus sp. F390]
MERCPARSDPVLWRDEQVNVAALHKRSRTWRVFAASSLLIAAFVTLDQHQDPPRSAQTEQIAAIPLHVEQHAAFSAALGPFTLTGAWRLVSDDAAFNSLSGLAMLPDGQMLAVSDRGYRIIMPAPGKTGATRIMETRIGDGRMFAIRDLEAVTVDARTGTYWIGIENLNGIARFEAGSITAPFVQPMAMAGWAKNRGPETLLRLQDGRFVVVSEERLPCRKDEFAALLFTGDPMERPEITRFTLHMPESYRPVDAAQLADGRILVLGRSFGLLKGFATIIAIADPGAIAANSIVQTKLLARLNSGPLTDNYEGIAVQQAADGGTIVWLVSDDNLAQFIQQTFLLQLHLEPGAP